MRKLAGILLTLALAGACSARNGAAIDRSVTFRVHETRRAFTLTIEERGRAPLRIEGDAKGTPLVATRGGAAVAPHEAGEQRRVLLQYLDSHIDRLEGVKEVAADVRWMKEFRKAYGPGSR